LIKVLFGQKAAERVHIVYGGSLDSKNIGPFVEQSDLDGFLVGGASLDHKEFSRIVLRVDQGKPKKASKEKSLGKKKTTKKDLKENKSNSRKAK
jgi:hypothetical protein